MLGVTGGSLGAKPQLGASEASLEYAKDLASEIKSFGVTGGWRRSPQLGASEASLEYAKDVASEIKSFSVTGGLEASDASLE